MSKRIKHLTAEQIKAESDRFWSATDDAIFPPMTVAIVLGKSLSWLQAKRCNGDGIPFIKHSKKVIYYQKSDVMAFINQFGKVPHHHTPIITITNKLYPRACLHSFIRSSRLLPNMVFSISFMACLNFLSLICMYPAVTSLLLLWLSRRLMVYCP